MTDMSGCPRDVAAAVQQAAADRTCDDPQQAPAAACSTIAGAHGADMQHNKGWTDAPKTQATQQVQSYVSDPVSAMAVQQIHCAVLPHDELLKGSWTPLNMFTSACPHALASTREAWCALTMLRNMDF